MTDSGASFSSRRAASNYPPSPACAPRGPASASFRLSCLREDSAASRGCGAPPGSRASPLLRPRALGFGSGCHSPDVLATCRRTQLSRSIRATAASGLGTRSQVGVSMSTSWRRGREDSGTPRRLGRLRWRRRWQRARAGRGAGNPESGGARARARFKEPRDRALLMCPRPAPAAPPHSRLRPDYWPSRWAAPGQSPPLSRLLRGGNSQG